MFGFALRHSFHLSFFDCLCHDIETYTFRFLRLLSYAKVVNVIAFYLSEASEVDPGVGTLGLASLLALYFDCHS
jgi:hypothetical protein